MSTPMNLAFRKMHGAGNDFMVLDARAEQLSLSPARIRALGDRRTGIGWDQLIVLEPPQHPEAQVFMRIYNPDGSSAGACGNATRCVAAFLGTQSAARDVTIQTISGLLPTRRLGNDRIEADMGAPRLEWRDIPLVEPQNTLHLNLPGDPAAVSMGNPHATLFVSDLAAIDPASLGATLETNPLFPDRANIGFAQILAPDRLRLRVWERGAGLTRACGSGGCAALVNAVRRGLTNRSAEIILDGGTLHIEWREQDSHVLMTGPTALAFQGEVDLSTYPA